MTDRYIHGYTDEEQQRLAEQALIFENIVYEKVDLGFVQNLLEVGCGVGAQTQILLRRFPHLNVTGVDISDVQLATAEQALKNSPFAGRGKFLKQDAAQMSFLENSFDGAFLCWILEHVPDPKAVLSDVHRVLKPGAPIYVSEVNNATLFVDPYSPATLKYWFAFNDRQWRLGGDPFVGAKLGNLLAGAGFKDVKTEIKTCLYDNRTPKKRAQLFTYMTKLLLSGAPGLIKDGYLTQEAADEMTNELSALAKAPDSVYYYSFVQASAIAD